MVFIVGGVEKREEFIGEFTVLFLSLFSADLVIWWTNCSTICCRQSIGNGRMDCLHSGDHTEVGKSQMFVAITNAITFNVMNIGVEHWIFFKSKSTPMVNNE